MHWVEVSVSDWFKTCTQHTKAPPKTTVFKAWRVPEKGTEPGMCAAVNEGCNQYLAASGCTAFTTCCTYTLKDKVTSELNAEEDLDYNGDRPDLVIFPKHPDAVAAHLWKDTSGASSESHATEAQDDPIPSAGPESLSSHRDALPMSRVAVPHVAKGAVSDDSPLQEDPASGDIPPPEAIWGCMSWAWAEVLIEVKKGRDRFPFLHGKDAEFAPSGDKHVVARGKIAEYALEVLRQQHRQAVFLLLILDDHARFLRFDRDGAIVSAAFNYKNEPRKMGEFFYRLFNKDTREDQRGRDPTARLVTGQDAEDFRQLYTRFLNIPDTANALKFAGTRGWPVYDLKVTGTWSPDGDSPLTTSSSSAATTHICRGGRPSFASTSVMGRSTRCFAAYDTTLSKPIFIKDTWRVDSPAVRTEADNYKTIWGRVAAIAAEQAQRNKNLDSHGERLLPAAAQSVPSPYVPTLLCHGDVFSPGPATAARASGSGADICTRGSTPVVQRTLTQQLSNTSQQSTRIHHRLVFKEICHTIEDFRTPYELAAAMYSAILAHQFAWDQCGILHQDVSVGNILMYRNPAKPGKLRVGLLADWDLAKIREQLEDPGATQVSRSGTWQFMSALVQNYVNKVHAVSDDLESFLHVLNWCALRYLPHKLSGKPGQLSSYCFNIYDKAIRTPPMRSTLGLAFEVEGPYEKFNAVRTGLRVVTGFPIEAHPFDTLLNELTALCKSHYDTVDFETLLPKQPEVAADPEDSDEPWELDDSLTLPVDEDSTATPFTDDGGTTANITAARAPQDSPLKDHVAFRLAFYRTVVKRKDDWRKPQNLKLVRLDEQIPFLTSFGSFTNRTGLKHERQLSLPTKPEENMEGNTPR